jgi:hypothetical protein
MIPTFIPPHQPWSDRCNAYSTEGERCLNKAVGPPDSTDPDADLCPDHQAAMAEMRAYTDHLNAQPTTTERLDVIERLPVVALNKPQGAPET